MLFTKLTKTLFLLLAGLMAAQAALAQVSYKFTEIKIPHAQTVRVFGVNDSGVMSGYYIDSSGSHGFMRSGPTTTVITDPKEVGTSTLCFAINSSGAIVGSYGNGTFSNGFVYQNGGFTDVIPPSAVGTTAYGINDAGWIVGSFIDNVGQHGFVFNGSTYTTLDAPGTTNGATLALGINSSNLITVQAFNSSGFLTSYLYDGTNWTPLSVPSAVITAIHSINNRDEIAFGWFDSSNAEHGAILANGVYYVVDDPGGTNTEVDTINNHNEIVGRYLPTGAANPQGLKGLNTPSILSFNPPSGPVGTMVTITGSGFTQTTSVMFGTKAASFTVNSDTQVTATVPNKAKTGKIKITTPAGSATSKTSFTVT